VEIELMGATDALTEGDILGSPRNSVPVEAP
jgi:hypothetical protein